MYLLPECEWRALRLLATAVAGEGRAGLVLRALEGKVYVDPEQLGSFTYFDERTFKIDKLVYGRRLCPYIMVHEFGHAYHCYYWPVLTALMTPPSDRAEAVAYLFEHELQAHAERYWIYNPPQGFRHFGYLATSTWQARRRDLCAYRRENRAPFDILEQIVHTSRLTVDFHTLVERIVNGGGS